MRFVVFWNSAVVTSFSSTTDFKKEHQNWLRLLNRRKSATSWLYCNFTFAGILDDGVIGLFLTSWTVKIMVWMVAKWSIYVRFVSVKRRIDTIRWEGKLIDEIYLKTHSKSSFSFLGISFRSLETILWIAHCVHNVNGHSLKTSCISGIIVEAKKKTPQCRPCVLIASRGWPFLSFTISLVERPHSWFLWLP